MLTVCASGGMPTLVVFRVEVYTYNIYVVECCDEDREIVQKRRESSGTFAEGVSLSWPRGVHQARRERCRAVTEVQIVGDIDGESGQVPGGLHGDSRAACRHRPSGAVAVKWM